MIALSYNQYSNSSMNSSKLCKIQIKISNLSSEEYIRFWLSLLYNFLNRTNSRSIRDMTLKKIWHHISRRLLKDAFLLTLSCAISYSIFQKRVMILISKTSQGTNKIWISSVQTIPRLCINS